jgi:hypothetical protein
MNMNKSPSMLSLIHENSSLRKEEKGKRRGIGATFIDGAFVLSDA